MAFIRLRYVFSIPVLMKEHDLLLTGDSKFRQLLQGVLK